MTLSYEPDTLARLDALLDRADIADVMLRYATGVDSRDWELYRSCFAETIEADYSSVFGTPAMRLDADAWVATIAPVMTALTATQHMITNIVITFDDGAHATCVAYVRARHHRPNSAGDSDQTVYGYYTNRFEKSADGWKITACRLTASWMTGNSAIFGALPSAPDPA